jgi:hypothetical protein
MVDDGCNLFFERFRRCTYVTPRSYFGFIDLYRDVYVKKVAKVEELATSINNGLIKLEQASADVNVMKIELREKVLAVAVAQSGQLRQEITTSTARAEKKKAEVQSVKDVLSVEANAIGEDKAIVEADLLAAKPALDEAITGKDIGMLKSLKKRGSTTRRGAGGRWPSRRRLSRRTRRCAGAMRRRRSPSSSGARRLRRGADARPRRRARSRAVRGCPASSAGCGTRWSSVHSARRSCGA